MRLSPLTRRRLDAFRRNRRGFWALWLFLGLFVLTLGAELVANDRPLMVGYQGSLYFPVFKDYPEVTFGGDFLTYTDYRDPYIAQKIAENGWALWPPLRHDHQSISYDVTRPHPSPPSAENPLGTDDQGRDVLARLIYGLRLSILFGLTLTLVSSAVGVAVGAVQGYFGGRVDLLGQRFLEIWGGLPQLLILIIVASMIAPGFWTLLGVLVLFSWTSLVGVVRAEFLRARNFDYVRAAQALGMDDLRVIMRHVLPNAMVATLTFMPFILSSSIVSLTALDFLGLGLPPGSPSLGDLLAQGKANLQAPWLGIAGFVVVAALLSLLVFVGEAVRDAFDPRKTNQ
ncbi:ABC transporter permease [Magnetospirillum aberrantis]|uniref:ABC transporter permease n=1 Tax=Magnetospirillum aberrantis SpK TaxID=908842 RepID=A0A7C9UUB5_9PROT|nr:ABC transporter permease [Magnetospirillum aberrantis]NFV78652.1 ABC transporter permease [Magnetospirillum aberrantis SpK]